MVLGLGIVLGLWWSQQREHAAERELFDKIEYAISKNPPDARDVVSAFDLTPDCAVETCFFKEGSIGALTFEKGNIRPTKNGLILVLEKFSGACVRVTQIESRFNTSQPTPGCASGGCWYREAQYDWGIVGFGLDQKNASCASSVVINSRPHQRPKD